MPSLDKYIQYVKYSPIKVKNCVIYLVAMHFIMFICLRCDGNFVRYVNVMCHNNKQSVMERSTFCSFKCQFVFFYEIFKKLNFTYEGAIG